MCGFHRTFVIYFEIASEKSKTSVLYLDNGC